MRYWDTKVQSSSAVVASGHAGRITKGMLTSGVEVSALRMRANPRASEHCLLYS